ncbi:unnamed protein product [Cuscuta campestris]|uniref:Uncharacterized protein n=1 Tax=Cuscuta campestris TaxID=132261 RepID=A0A484KJU2_9ASTE|nr:unnamed protein product [Cuscuta campestris]
MLRLRLSITYKNQLHLFLCLSEALCTPGGSDLGSGGASETLVQTPTGSRSSKMTGGGPLIIILCGLFWLS